LYADLLKRWEQLGAVSLRYAFSRASDQSEGCKYVQDRLYQDRQEIVDLFEAGAKLFVCGSRDVGDGAQETLIKIAKETKMKKEGREVDDQKAREWVSETKGKLSDIVLVFDPANFVQIRDRRVCLNIRLALQL
jgi:cytochrome P450/NADPH-cytochrome P450 reductase